MTWEAFSQRIQEHFCPSGQKRWIEQEFIALEKKPFLLQNTIPCCLRSYSSGIFFFPKEKKQVEHYHEGLPKKYRATMRKHSTLAAAMDEAIQIKVDLATLRPTVVKSGEKRRWEGHSDSSKKKMSIFRKQGDKPNYYGKCRSFHKGPCSSITTTISCRCCGKLGHKISKCMNTKPLYYNSK